MITKYPSKISYPLLIIVFIIFFCAPIFNFIESGISIDLVLNSSFLMIVFGFVIHIFFSTAYIIEGNELKVRCGFKSYPPIVIKEIKEIKKTNNMISAPAASFDRIAIKYGKFEEIIISPKNKLEFVKHLVDINPSIESDINKK